jgi:hypothetical protein
VPGLSNDQKIRRLVLFFRRFASQPEFDIDSVPAKLDMSIGRRVWFGRIQLLAAVVLAIVVFISLYQLATDFRHFDVVQSVCDFIPSAVVLAGIRFGLIRVQATFGPSDVTVTERAKTWTEPISAYTGLSWIYFTTASYSQLLPSKTSESSSIPTTSGYHWIELVHPNPEKTLVLAVNRGDLDMRRLLVRYAIFLNRPILESGVEAKA